MSTQLAFPFADVPITCPIQRRYHAIAPLLAGYRSMAEQAQALSIGYSTVSRWLRTASHALAFGQATLKQLLATDVSQISHV